MNRGKWYFAYTLRDTFGGGLEPGQRGLQLIFLLHEGLFLSLQVLRPCLVLSKEIEIGLGP